MRNSGLIMLIGIIMAGCFGCGGGSGSSLGSAGMSPVTLEIGSPHAAGRAGLSFASKAIPDDVVLVRITVDAPDMQTIVTTVPLSADSMSTVIQVPNGLNRHFAVEALNAEGIVLYRGEVFANLDGSPATLAVSMTATGQKTPPDFRGLDEVKPLSTASLLLTWAPASDSLTPSGSIQYLIYMATTPGAQDMTTPSFTMPQGTAAVDGKLTFLVSGLKPGTTYYFRVRAMDEQGNVDPNTVEKSGTTLPVVAPPPIDPGTPGSQDTTPPSFSGIASAVANSENVIQISWKPAVDLVTPASEIIYRVYKATQSGGQDFSMPALTTAPGVTAVLVPNLTSGITYYFVVRAEDRAGNRDSNTIERSATTKFIDLLPLDDGLGINEELLFRVKNNGTEYVYNVETWVLYRLGSFTDCQTFTAPAIRPGAWFAFTTWVYSPDYLIVVDPQERIREKDETNNKACSGAFCTDPPPIPSVCNFVGN